MRKVTLLAVLSIAQSIFGQDLTYLNELGQSPYSGDPWYNSMSGSAIALSGSLTALAENPAGAAFYRQPAWSMSGNILSQTNRSQDGNSSILGGVSNLNIAQLGFVNSEPSEVWRWFFVMNTDQHYRNEVNVNGELGNSIQQQWIDNSSGTPPDFLPYAGIYEDMLYQSYATDYDSLSSSYYSTAVLPNAITNHTYKRTGLRNQWTLGLARSFGPTLHFGASFSLLHSYEQVSTYHKESYPITTDLSSFRVTDYWKNSGFGISANAGIIYRPIQSIRLASSLQLPSIYSFEQTWSVEMAVYRPSISSSIITEESVGAGYEWFASTGPRLNSGMAVVLGRTGLISFSHTLLASHWTRAYKDEAYLNAIIDTALGWQHNITIGGELRLGPLGLRGGTGVRGLGGSNLNPLNVLSFGFSLTDHNFRYELSWIGYFRSERYYPYSKDYTLPVTYNSVRGLLTAGAVWKF